MPHFETVQSFFDQILDLPVGKQRRVSAQISRMGDDHHSPAFFTVATTSYVDGEGVGM